MKIEHENTFQPGGPGGGNFTVMSEMQKRLIEFAEYALREMEETKDWDADMTDRICEKAFDLELADHNEYHEFTRVFRPGRHRLHRLLETPADERSEQVRYLIDTKEIDT